MLNQLGKICGKERTIPRAMLIDPASVHYLSANPEFGGGFGDVYQGEYDGHQVAIKVLRLSLRCNRNRRISVRTLLHIIYGAPELRVSFIGLLPRGGHMEPPTTSEYPTVVRRDDGPASVEIHVGVKVDGERQHQLVHQGPSRGESSPTCELSLSL